MKPMHLVIINLLIILFVTGFAWTLFMIFFALFGVIGLAGAAFAGAIDRL
jgi:hypothetical protein